jgi:hypothetical protein
MPISPQTAMKTAIVVEIARLSVPSRNCEAHHMLPALHALSKRLAGLLAGPVNVEDGIHVDATENGLVVQIRALRPLP